MRKSQILVENMNDTSFAVVRAAGGEVPDDSRKHKGSRRISLVDN